MPTRYITGAASFSCSLNSRTPYPPHQRETLLMRSITCHRSALQLGDPDNTDALFNIAQAVRSLLEEGAANSESLGAEADAALEKVLTLQAAEWEAARAAGGADAMAVEADAAPAVEEADAMEDDGDEGYEEAADEKEPVTPSVIIDTLVAHVQLLTLMGPLSTNPSEFFDRADAKLTATVSWIALLAGGSEPADVGIAAAAVMRARGEHALSVGDASWVEWFKMARARLEGVHGAEAAADKGDLEVGLAEGWMAAGAIPGLAVVGQWVASSGVAFGSGSSSGAESEQQVMIARLRDVYTAASRSFSAAHALEPANASVLVRLADVEGSRSLLYPVSEKTRTTLISNALVYYKRALAALSVPFPLPIRLQATNDEEACVKALIGVAKCVSQAETVSDADLKVCRSCLEAVKRRGASLEESELALEFGSPAMEIVKKLFALLETSEAVLKAHCAAYARGLTTPGTANLRSIDTYIHQAQDKTQALRAVYDPLREKVLKKNPHIRGRCTILLHWLLTGPHGAYLSTSVLLPDLTSTDKKQKLAVALVLTDVLSQLPPSRTPVPSQRERDLRALFGPLLEIVENDGVLDQERGVRMETRLTSVAAHVGLEMVSRWYEELAGGGRDLVVKNGDEEAAGPARENFRVLIGMSVRLLRALRQYDSNPFKNASIDTCCECLQALASAMVPDSTTAMMFWQAVAGGISSKILSVKLPKLESKVAKMLDVTEVGDIVSNPESTFFAVTTLCLAFSFRPYDDFCTIAASDAIGPKLYALVSKNFQCMVPEAHYGRSLGFILLRQLISISGPDTVRPIVEPLLNLLDDDDLSAVDADGVAGMLADFATSFPEEILIDVFSRLDSEEPAKRRNALRIITRIFEMKRDAVLGDDPLHKGLRWGPTYPHTVITELCGYLEDRDARVRSSAELALVSTLSSHRASVDAAMVFLEYIRSVPKAAAESKSSVPATPAEIKAPQSTKDNKNMPRLDRLMNVTKKWSISVDPKAWPAIASRLVDKMYSAPDDGLVIRFVASVAESWVDIATGAAVLSRALSIMRSQPRLTDELLNDPSSASAFSVRDLLLLRLSPMLALKMVPISALGLLDGHKEFSIRNYTCNPAVVDAESCYGVYTDSKVLTETLVDELIKRCEHPFEYDEVRKLAAELLGHLPLAVTSKLLQAKLRTAVEHKDAALARSYVFTTYCMLCAQESACIAVVIELLPLLLEVLSWPGEEHGKAQVGCIECLSIAVVLHLKERREVKRPLIVDLENSSNLAKGHEQDFGVIIDLIKRLLRPGWATTAGALTQFETIAAWSKSQPPDLLEPAITTPIANVITTAVKRLCGTDDFTRADIDPAKKGDVLRMSQYLLSSLIALANARSAGAEDSQLYVAAACFQVRLAALKLLGACLSCSNETLTSVIGPLGMNKVKLAVASRCNIESDKQVRELAERIMHSFERA
ncbi:hypothetical protein HK101_011041 [Irineochytrium annulatum]|nr:hypothetical protein HK101_011041 [Irineochytrium annulatum]